MSIEVELNDSDYQTVINWYEFSFADGKKKPKDSDIATLQKLTVMARQYIEMVNFLKKHDKG